MATQVSNDTIQQIAREFQIEEREVRRAFDPEMVTPRHDRDLQGELGGPAKTDAIDLWSRLRPGDRLRAPLIRHFATFFRL